MPRLTLAQASLIVDAALAHAREAGLKPMCVAVVDAGGCLLALKREEAASLLRPEIAIGKAVGALGMGFGSREIANRAAQNPVFFGALSAMTGGRLVPSAGGVLIHDAQGEVVGAVGVSGDKPDADEACALTGIAAAGLRGSPGEPS
jgi:uncharacterized protein GlcG (DUF336 family)